MRSLGGLGSTIKILGSTIISTPNPARRKGKKARIYVWKFVQNEYGKVTETRIYPQCFGVNRDDDGAFSVPTALPRSPILEFEAAARGFTKCKAMLDFDPAVDRKLRLADIVLEPLKK